MSDNRQDSKEDGDSSSVTPEMSSVGKFSNRSEEGSHHYAHCFWNVSTLKTVVTKEDRNVTAGQLDSYNNCSHSSVVGTHGIRQEKINF